MLRDFKVLIADESFMGVDLQLAFYFINPKVFIALMVLMITYILAYSGSVWITKDKIEYLKIITMILIVCINIVLY